jgi:uncharacterized protein YuzE
MKITLDKSIDAVYIYLKESIKPGEVKITYPCNPVEVKGEINLDLDNNGILIGMEIQNASKKLPKELLEKAEVL